MDFPVLANTFEYFFPADTFIVTDLTGVESIKEIPVHLPYATSLEKHNHYHPLD